MRKAGAISTRQDAERFASYLLTLGISSKLAPADGAWEIWVLDENQIPRSKQELGDFQADPQGERYRHAEQSARQVRTEAATKERQAKKNLHDLRDQWASPYRRRPITMLLIGISIVALLTGVQDRTLDFYFSFAGIAHGQIWRLVTPIFMHADPLHLLFNMWMMYDLGTLVEQKLGSVRYLLLVLVIAVISNLTQALAQGEAFLGMSGVVYGLFGYCWIRGRLDPTSGLYLRSEVVFIMIGWFLLCFADFIRAANWAHGGGLAVGAAFGALPYFKRQLWK